MLFRGEIPIHDGTIIKAVRKNAAKKTYAKVVEYREFDTGWLRIKIANQHYQKKYML